jgi:phage tail protein X
LFTEPDNYSQEWRDMQKHTTKEGDTLESIATELYGKAGAVVSAIYNANIRRLRSYGPRGEIPAGTVLTVPSVASSDDTEAHEVASPAVAVPASTAKAPIAGSPKAAADTAPPADDVATAETPVAPAASLPAPPVTKTTSFEERIASLVKDYADELDAALGAYLSTHKAAILEAAVAALTKVLEAL